MSFNQSELNKAVDLLHQGKLVAFPTETVYGLGAHALDAAAVERIFLAKGRPSTNPVIVHVADLEAARALTSDWPAKAQQLAEAFWPGPLTLVLPRGKLIPDIVTAGGVTVALRCPAHPIAQILLQAAKIPIAAPSANRSGNLSPTTAEHVRQELEGRVDLILDGGPTPLGIESTVMDMTSSPPTLLRPGTISPSQIEKVIGVINHIFRVSSGEVLPSPGLLTKHYAPRTRLRLFSSRRELEEFSFLEAKFGLISFGKWRRGVVQPVRVEEMPITPEEYAARIYAALHDFDALHLDFILLELPPEGDRWLGIHDRLRRAAYAEVRSADFGVQN